MAEHVLITGGSGGIGKALVRAFSKKGFRVSFTYNRSCDSALELERETGAKGFCVNFEDLASVLSFSEKICVEVAPVDVLVNNVGAALYGLIQDVTKDDFQRLFNVNFQSPFFLTQRLIPSMLSKQKGTIINIASVWGETGASCEVLYSSTKGALIAFTKALAKELAPSGISVNCISPGVVDTAMISRFSDEEKNALAEEIPAGRFTDADEIAKLALFLTEGASVSMTGQVIGVNGGMYC